MKKEVNTHEAKTQLSKLLRRVAAGEEITIANRGVPVALLVPVRSRKTKRQLGAYGEAIKIADDFNAALPEDLLNLFDGGVKQTTKKK